MYVTQAAGWVIWINGSPLQGYQVKQKFPDDPITNILVTALLENINLVGYVLN